MPEPKRLVTAAAIVGDGRVLAARRSYPASLAGKWEFPGGKAEPGESPHEALARELREELGIDVSIGTEIRTPQDAPWPINERLELRLWWAAIVAGVPTTGDSHDRLAWCTPAELPGLDWLPADRPMIPVIVEQLGLER